MIYDRQLDSFYLQNSKRQKRIVEIYAEMPSHYIITKQMPFSVFHKTCWMDSMFSPTVQYTYLTVN